MKILTKKFFYLFFLIISIASFAMQDKEIPKKQVEINKRSDSYFEELPTELKEIIIRFLLDIKTENQVKQAIKNIKSLSLVNKEFRDIVNSEHFAKYVIITLNELLQMDPLEIAIQINTIGALQWFINTFLPIKLETIGFTDYQKREINSFLPKLSTELSVKQIRKISLNIRKIENFLMFRDKDSCKFIRSTKFIKFFIENLSKISKFDPVGIAIVYCRPEAAEWIKNEAQTNPKIKYYRDSYFSEFLQDYLGFKNKIFTTWKLDLENILNLYFLLKAGGNPDTIVDAKGNTALHKIITGYNYAKKSSDLEQRTENLMKIFLDKGANPHKKNIYGQTAYSLSTKNLNFRRHFDLYSKKTECILS